MRVIAEDLWFPEGPVWVGDGSLLVVEIRRKTLTRIWPNGRKAIVADARRRSERCRDGTGRTLLRREQRRLQVRAARRRPVRDRRHAG